MNEAALPFVGDNIWALIACGLYFAILVGIGIYSARFSTRGQEAFLLGGRRLNALVVGLSAVVSGRSAWLLLSVSGLAFVYGISTLWYAVGYTVVELIMFLTIARRLRASSELKGDITIPDLITSAFDDRHSLLRILASMIILVFMVTYVGAQIKAGGKALTAGFHLPEWEGVLITGAVILLYTAVGGFLAVSLTDVLQAAMMLISLIALPIVAMFYYGGPAALMESLGPGMLDFSLLPVGVVAGAVGIGLGSTGSPHILVRFLSIENEKKLRIAGYLGFFWNIVMALGAVSIGLVGSAFVNLAELPGMDREMIFPVLAGVLPPFLFGLVIASVFSAIMSTADSQLLVAASAAVRDIYEKVIRKKDQVSDRLMVHLNRLSVFILCIAGIGIALYASEYVNFLVLLAWTGLGCTFGPAIILITYWKGTTRAGVICGLFAGTVATFVWGLTPWLKAIVHEVIPVFLITLCVILLVSLATRKEESRGQTTFQN